MTMASTTTTPSVPLDLQRRGRLKIMVFQRAVVEVILAAPTAVDRTATAEGR